MVPLTVGSKGSKGHLLLAVSHCSVPKKPKGRLRCRPLKVGGGIQPLIGHRPHPGNHIHRCRGILSSGGLVSTKKSLGETAMNEKSRGETVVFASCQIFGRSVQLSEPLRWDLIDLRALVKCTFEVSFSIGLRCFFFMQAHLEVLSADAAWSAS
jgi:hypothetical protein